MSWGPHNQISYYKYWSNSTVSYIHTSTYALSSSIHHLSRYLSDSEQLSLYQNFRKHIAFIVPYIHCTTLGKKEVLVQFILLILLIVKSIKICKLYNSLMEWLISYISRSSFQKVTRDLIFVVLWNLRKSASNDPTLKGSDKIPPTSSYCLILG